MEEVAGFLLDLYRDARAYEPDAFRERILCRVRKSVSGSAALWGEARRTWDSNLLVPTALHIQNLDSRFLVEWARAVTEDRAATLVMANPGRLLRVDVPVFYRPLPELLDLALRHRFGGLNCILLNGIEPGQVHWLSLFNAEAGSVCTIEERDWLESMMPHLTEAWCINSAINARHTDGAEAAQRGVAESSGGMLLRVGAGLVATLAHEWTGFDGWHVPRPLMLAWQNDPMFIFSTARVRIEGRRCGELVYLSGRSRSDLEALTARQSDIADLFAQGLTSKQIARLRQLSPATVRNHLARVYAVLGVHGRVEMTHRIAELSKGTPGPTRAASSRT